MKQLIVLCAVTIILLTFPLQYSIEQKNHHNILELQKIVHNAKEQAKQKGYFTSEIISNMRNDIMDEFDIARPDDIIILTTTNKKYRQDNFNRDNMIHYRAEVPIKRIIACNSFWNIEDSDNNMNYVIDSYTSSELILK